MLLLKYTLILLHVVLVLGKGNETKLTDNNTSAATLSGVETTKATTVISTSKQTTTETPNVTDTTPKPSTPTTTSTTTITPTTSSPPTSTLAPTTTTVAPKPDHWVVYGENGTACILAKMDLKLDLKLNGQSKDLSYDIPKNAEASGACGENQQTLVLQWDKNQVAMIFKANETLEKYFLDSVSVEVVADNSTVKLTKENMQMFETALDHSYLCSYSDPLKITQNNDTGLLSFSNIKLEAFNRNNSTSFSNISACPPDTPDIVPIVVGCALTVLVVVVLIAYLVSRRRTQARGYLSM